MVYTEEKGKVIRTSSGDRKIPVVASHGTAAWLDEEEAYTESDESFSQVTIGAHKLGTMILGKPVKTSAFMPTIAASAKTVVFGDIGYYWIADRQGRAFKKLSELYAATGQIGFLASQRVDGKLILPEAVKVIAQHA